MTAYPEHELLAASAEEHQNVLDFLEYLSANNVALVQMPFEEIGWGGVVVPSPMGEFERGDLVGRWLGVDPDAFRAEKDAMLAAARGGV